MRKKLDLEAPLRLGHDEIVDHIVADAIGVFALGHLSLAGSFVIASVGASYGSLRDELTGRIGTASHFRYRVYESHRQAFEKLCHMYHDFRPGGNIMHPARPRGSSWACPRCHGELWPAGLTHR